MSGKILKTGCLAAELGKPENVIAIVNAVEEGIGNDPGAAQAIADAIADKLPIASTEQKGIVELATNAEAVVGTSTTLAVTPAGLKVAIDGAALPAATDTIQGKVALNLGTSLPGDATNTTDALTADGFNTLANSTTTAGGNALQQAIVNAVERAIGGDQGAQTAIANAIKEEIAAALAADAAAMSALSQAFPVATDTAQGKVALNKGTATTDPTNATDALTAFGFNALASSTATAGGNALQKAIVDAVQQAIGGDTGAQQALADAIADNLASAAGFAASVKAAETKTTLAVSGVNYVYTNEAGVATVLQPGQFLSSDAGNALAVDAQGRIKVSIPAQLPDDQVLSGDNSGTVGLTLTPTVVGGQTNYTIKADLKVAAQTPTSTTNMLKLSASGFYVSMEEVVDALIANPTKLAALAAALSTAMPDAFDA